MSAGGGARPGQRPDCVVCQRPFGRRRKVAQELLDQPVCDQCWHLAGGADAVLARVRAAMNGEPTGPFLALDPRADELIATANPNDLLHPNDRLAVDSGIRWSTLRTIIPRDRLRLVTMIDQNAGRRPPNTTRPDDAPAWLMLVADHIRADTEQFKQRNGSKRSRWWRIARVFAICADRDRRPLTWAAHDVVAEAVGCSTKTVQRCLRWLEKQGLIWEVVPGCVLRRCQTSEADHPRTGETDEQRQARQEHDVLAEAAAVVDAAARRIRTEAELIAVDAGLGGAAALAAADIMLADQPGYPHAPISDVDQDHEPDTRRPPLWEQHPEEWVNLAPVYELRVPLPPAEQAEVARIVAAIGPPPPTEGELLAELHRNNWLHPDNVLRNGFEAVLITHDGWTGLVHADLDPQAFLAAIDAVTSGNAAALVRTSSFVHPPKVATYGEIESRTQNLWINGRAPRDSSKRDTPSQGNPSDVSAHTETTNDGEAVQKRQVKPIPESRRVAEWLFRAALDPVLCEGLTPEFEHTLAAVIAGTGLLRHGWTWNDLRDEIHGLPERLHLPRWIRNPKAFILARLRDADPHLPPSKRKVILDAERGTKWFAENRHRLAETERNARRSAIDACPLCDHNGILDLGGDAPLVRCTHDADSGGW
ncbi:hypothetical protein ACFXGA_26995 [Actinosynnema sp. NPDC059335]|uniref:hypothetical protein n=1 Tax=Actinosynnema sp. NPDC059335 TaxID=3346804 RepID=UPI00366E9598